MSKLPITKRTRIRRSPHRAVSDREAMNAVLDEGLVCHLGFVDAEHPFVIPTIYARSGDFLYIHGSTGSRALRRSDGRQVCVTVTLTDGLVLARSAFFHSMNYRCVVVLGVAEPVTDAAEKLEALTIITNHLIPGRWDDVRQPNRKELKSTSVLRVSLQEASLKVRSGPPIDEDEDLERDTWAGVVPIVSTFLPPVNEPRLRPETPIPGYLDNYSRPAPAEQAAQMERGGSATRNRRGG